MPINDLSLNQVLLSGKVEALKKAVERAQELEEEFDYDVLKDHLEEYEVSGRGFRHLRGDSTSGKTGPGGI